MELDEIVTSTDLLSKEKERKEKDEKDKLTAKKAEPAAADAEKTDASSPDKSATPNLNAWLKAFGVSKKPKKEDEPRKEEKTLASLSSAQPTGAFASEQNFTSPAPRTMRKASTGSTISERSSFSQDPDSPRVGIDERLSGAYPAPYPSPLGASPIMNSPKEDVPKPASPFAMNGAIRVGFYQDMTTKSSPEKSCSPREQPSASPYSNYAQHLYVSTTTAAAAATTNSTAYSNLSYTSPAGITQQTTSLGFNNKNKTPSYFDQYKQPKSQDSDYNSSVGSNPNSPYQSQHSPYQADSYQQPQTSPYAQNPAMQSSSPVHAQAPTPTNAASAEPSNSPHSPYAESVGSYHSQQPVSPYQQLSPVVNSPSIENAKPAHQQQQQHPAQPQATSFNQSSPMAEQERQPSPYSQLPQHPSAHLSPVGVKSPLHPQQQQQQQVQQDPISMSANVSHLQHDAVVSQQLGPSNLHNYMSFSSGYGNNQSYANLMDTAAGMSPMLMPTMANKMSPASGKPDINDDDQRELLNLDATKPSMLGVKSSVNDQLSKAPQGYDYSMFDPMAFNKDMSTSKALEMYNRAATMSFSKTFPTPLTSDKLGANDMTTKPPQHEQSAIAMNPYQQHSKQPAYGKPSGPNELLNIGGYPIDNKNSHHGYGQQDMDPRYDMGGYKPNMFVPSDDGMNGCYYQKDMGGQAVYGKSLHPQASAVSSLQQMLKTPAYNSSRLNEMPASQAAPVQQPQPEPKPKRTRKKKNAEPPPASQAAPQPQMNAMTHQQAPLHQPIHDQHVSQASASAYHHQQQLANQGFQSYGLKSLNAAPPKATPPPETTAISLKTSSAIVPGSAFNFGPTSAGLGLAPGIYGENTAYLEDYRTAPNPYAYLPQTHRNPADPNVDGSSGAAAGPPPTPASAYHQFIPHPSPRGTYPFMNPPLDTSSQFYQQYLRNEEYRQARMMLNQGILGSAPSHYAQPGYHPPIGMHNAMNRPPWFP